MRWASDTAWNPGSCYLRIGTAWLQTEELALGPSPTCVLEFAGWSFGIGSPLGERCMVEVVQRSAAHRIHALKLIQPAVAVPVITDNPVGRSGC